MIVVCLCPSWSEFSAAARRVPVHQFVVVPVLMPVPAPKLFPLVRHYRISHVFRHRRAGNAAPPGPPADAAASEAVRPLALAVTAWSTGTGSGHNVPVPNAERAASGAATVTPRA
jgi:hypothetical protein